MTSIFLSQFFKITDVFDIIENICLLAQALEKRPEIIVSAFNFVHVPNNLSLGVPDLE
jgi:hypothetical protein